MPLHALTRWHLPSWQGGDVDQPLCLRPGPVGVSGGRLAARHELTEDLAEVDCERCAARMPAHLARLGGAP